MEQQCDNHHHVTFTERKHRGKAPLNTSLGLMIRYSIAAQFSNLIGQKVVFDKSHLSEEIFSVHSWKESSVSELCNSQVFITGKVL